MATVKKTNLDLIKECDSFPYDQSTNSLYSFLLPNDPRPHGYMLSSTVKSMPWTKDFHVDHFHRRVQLQPALSVDTGTSALTALTDRAIEENTFRIIHAEHSELYPIVGSKSVPPVTLERYFSPIFGIISRGAHLTVYTRSKTSPKNPNDMKIWVPRRSEDCFTYPNCLDTTVAGGLPAGESPFDCIVREADEEASLDEGFVRTRAHACGLLSYISQSSRGDGGELGLIAPDLVYVYDLEVDQTVLCRPHDNEVKEFNLMTVQEVQRALAGGEFKTNSAVVMIDFFIRHGIVTAENEEDYAELLMRMHRRLPFPTSPGGKI